jgi:vitamin-K-epoxide reductase (warfarin-sensitive)
MTPGARRILLAISVLAVAGMIISSVSLYHHYGTDTNSFCDLGGEFNCDIVNRSVYSVVLGIPVAFIGIVGYALLLGLATFGRAKPEAPMLLLGSSLGGLCFAIYLTYVEGWVLGAWCILCLSSLTMISAIAVLSALMVVLRKRRA